MSENEWNDCSRTFLIRLLTASLIFNLIDFVFRFFTEKGLKVHYLRRSEGRNVLIPNKESRIQNIKQIIFNAVRLVGADIVGILTVKFCPYMSLLFYVLLIPKVYYLIFKDRIEFQYMYARHHIELFVTDYPIESRLKFVSNVILVLFMFSIYFAVVFHSFLVFGALFSQFFGANYLIILSVIVSIVLCGYYGRELWLLHRETQKHLPAPPPLQWLDRINFD